MILVYTGDGKGKTSACVGQTVRALGQNMAVAFGQFMKRDGQAGEQAMLAQVERATKEGKGVVAQGRMTGAGTFTASEVLAKHDENYMPPEAAKAVSDAQTRGAGNKAAETPGDDKMKTGY